MGVEDEDNLRCGFKAMLCRRVGQGRGGRGGTCGGALRPKEGSLLSASMHRRSRGKSKSMGERRSSVSNGDNEGGSGVDVADDIVGDGIGAGGGVGKVLVEEDVASVATAPLVRASISAMPSAATVCVRALLR